MPNVFVYVSKFMASLAPDIDTSNSKHVGFYNRWTLMTACFAVLFFLEIDPEHNIGRNI